MKKNLIILVIFLLSISQTNAWFGLIAENGDLLNISKWNQLVAEKLYRFDLKAGDNITLTNSGSEIYINGAVSGNGVPFISNVNQIILVKNDTKSVTLNGRNFTPTTIVSTTAGTITNLQIISPVELSFDLLAGNTAGNFDITLSNNGVINTYWIGNGVNLINIVDFITGNGPAGTYTENFESNSLGNWTTVAGLTANVSYQVDSGGTPSSNTGPNSGAGGSTYYIFPEASSPNYANKTFAIETDYFNQVQNISFDYHMFGDTIGVTIVQTFYDGVWTDVWSVSGQQQTAQGNAYLNTGNIDLSSHYAEKIRIFYTSGTSYTGDAAIDNIVINSN